MNLFKTRLFAKFARQERMADSSLRDAMERAERGLIDADLGGGLIKLRVARPGQGRSGGYRVIVAYRAHSRAVFLYGFAKNDRENIAPQELIELRLIGRNWLNASAVQMAAATEEGMILEISPGKTDGDENEDENDDEDQA